MSNSIFSGKPSEGSPWLHLFGALVLGAGLAVVAAFYGMGISHGARFVPKVAPHEFKHIGRDGWVQHGSRIELADLAERGNVLQLEFEDKRPVAAGYAHIVVSLCGKEVSDFSVYESSLSHKIHLTATCEPKEILFKVLNPYKAGGTESRPLGAVLKYAEITSKIGVPIVTLSKLALVAFLITAFACFAARLSWLLSRSRRVSALGYIASVLVVFIAVCFSSPFQHNKLFALCIVSIAVLLGAIVAFECSNGHWGESSDDLLPKAKCSENRTLRIVSAVCVGIAVLLGAGFRFYGIDFGLPQNFHPDEVMKVNAIMHMVEANSLDPNYFLHPSLLIYSTYFLNWFLRGLGVFTLLGYSGGIDDTAFLAGRLVSATAGTISVFLVYLIGRRLFGCFSGVLASFILAVMPLHITCSRYLKEDALLTCMILCSLLALLKAVQEDKKSWLLIAGILSGMAASTKYSGFLCFALIAAAPWVRSKKIFPEVSWLLPTLLAVCCIPVGFVLCTPYSVLSHEAFMKGFAFEQKHMNVGHMIAIDAWSQYWMFHVWRSIFPGMGVFDAIVSFCGLGVLLWRRKISDLYVVALFLLFYMPAEWVKAKPEPQPDRYILPCLPILALMAGEFVRELWRSRYQRLVPWVVLCLVFLPGLRAWHLASEIKPDTRELLGQWMTENIPMGSKVTLDWKAYGPVLPKGFFDTEYNEGSEGIGSLSNKDLKQSKGEYLVLSSLFYGRFVTQPLMIPEFRRRVRDVFERLPIVHVQQAKYGSYGFHNPTLVVFSMKAEDVDRLEEENRKKGQGLIEKTSNEIVFPMTWPQW